MIVMEHITVDRRSQFPWCGDLIDVNPVVLQGSEEPLRPGVVQTLAFTVHTDFDFVAFQ